MVLVTRAGSTSSKRVRKAPSLPDFELLQLPRSAIRKKPRLKVPHEKKKKMKAVAKEVVVVINQEEEKKEMEEEKEELDAVMRSLVGDFDVAVQSPQGDLLSVDALLDPDGTGMMMPQFDSDLESRATGAWTATEDAVLESAVAEHGARRWSLIAKRLPGRVGKQCRERWHNHLNPDVLKCPWTDAEDVTIQVGVIELGHKWSEIALRLPGRTDNAVKNRYNSKIRKLGGAAVLKEAEPRVSNEDFMHELMRRNVLAEEARAPGRFSPNQIESLTSGNVEILDTPGCRWSNNEHAQLRHAVPDNTHPNDVDWAAVSRAVPSRNAQACRRHWVKYLRGEWKLSQFQAQELEPAPAFAPWTEPDPCTEGVDVEAMVESLTTHGPLLTEYANHPDLELMAIETYSEGSCDATWSSSSVLVVGKPGLSFRFHTPGIAPPPVAPPKNKGSETDSESQLETVALSKWMKRKELEDEKALTERLEMQKEKWEAMVEKTREAKKKKKNDKTTATLPSKKMSTYFHAVKPQVPLSPPSSKEPWLRTLDALAPMPPPLVAFAVPVQA